MMKRIALAALLGAFPLTTNAAEATDAVTNFARAQAWITAPVVLEAIAAQNVRTASIGQPEINDLDQDWRDQVGMAETPLITSVMTTAASDHLRAHVEEAGGMITEVFVMDARGLNVASSTVTSDYWQGDEDKYIQTFMVGPDAIHVSEVEFDESTQTYQVQVSMAIADPDTGVAIGAVTFGIDAQSFF